MSRTLNYIILSNLFLLVLVHPLHSQSFQQGQGQGQQEYTPAVVKKEKDTTALWQGMLLEADLMPFVQTAFFDKETYKFQGNLQFNLKNKYFPLIEAGIAGTDKTGVQDIRYKTDGVFGKIGLDIPAIKPKAGTGAVNNFFLVGVRLGASHFNYSYYNLYLEDNYWGGSETVNAESLAATKLWFEIVAGIRVSVYKNIYMGWTVKNKQMINKAKPGGIAPWFIPGFGVEDGTSWGISYTLGYRFK